MVIRKDDDFMSNENEPVISYDPSTCTSGPGLTKREYFAAMAMKALLGNIGTFDLEIQLISLRAVIAAEHLLAELEKKQ